MDLKVKKANRDFDRTLKKLRYAEWEWEKACKRQAKARKLAEERAEKKAEKKSKRGK